MKGNASCLYKTVKIILKPLMKIFFPYTVRGKRILDSMEGAYILCSNHLSNLDSVFLVISHKSPIRFMAKSELFKNPALGYIFRKLGAFSVERGKGDKEALQNAERILKSGEILGIFIEGTRSKTGEFLRPRSGTALLACKAKLPVIPVCITGGGKNNKIRPFRRTTISYGKPMNILDITGTLDINIGTLRRVSGDIMGKIKEMR